MALPVIDTVNTTRIPLSNPNKVSVYVSRMLWPTKHSAKKPKVIILAPNGLFFYAYMAASLVHDPIVGVEMLIPLNELPEETIQEIKRLDPEGSSGLPPIVLVGPFKRCVAEAVERLGYKTLTICEKDIFETSARVAILRKRIIPESPDGPISLFIVSVSQPYDSLPVPYYATHSGVPILFTHPDRLPHATALILEKLCDNVVYTVGNECLISEQVIQQISDIVQPPVRRIAGRNPFETSVEFAAYYDPETKLGWNRNRKGRGDAFTFTNIDRWDLGIAAANFAHHGKHTPLLLTECDELPPCVRNYLDFLRPPHRMPPMPPFMHSFIIGEQRDISFQTQTKIDEHIQMEHK